VSDEQQPMWFIEERYDRFIAYGFIADRGGGARIPSKLSAPTLDELHAMLPPGLTRRQRTPFLPTEIIETWD
jgi:hypothetical protein